MMHREPENPTQEHTTFNGESRQKEQSLVEFGQKLASSENFKILFRDGMKLVEDSAAYLDGPGRIEARELPRGIGMVYASESMRLTTRLMQLASWLMLQRAVNRGELDHDEAKHDRRRTGLSNSAIGVPEHQFTQLPDSLQALITQSLKLQTRILVLDRIIFGDIFQKTDKITLSTIESQLERLRAAFTTPENFKTIPLQ